MKSLINIQEGSNLTEISPILTCLRSLKESEALWQGGKSECFKSLSLKQLKDEASISKEDGFCFAVSLQDGSALYMSSSITLHLGYPKNMLVGQCIMNFLYQKDHITFANHLTQGLNACFIQGKRDDSHLVPNAFFCRLRLYHGLKYGYGVSERKTQYKPFKVTLHIKDLILDDIYVEKCASTLCVKATATPVSSAYTVPDEIPAMTSFSTRHTASCHFSHVDASAIPYLGFLPQDMVGYSVFDFYHVDDMPHMKDIYELVVKEQGTSFRSKPYRFKVQNGCFVMLETEWSCFINPWSQKLEFVVGQHRVLKGPADVNIFNLCEIEEVIVPDEILKESCNIQKEIKTLLAQSIKNTRAEKSKRICNKRKRDLASFVNNCIDEEYGCITLKYAQKQSCVEDACNSDLDSVVIGNISLYRGANDSSCSETSTTVQQLQYQENIERFFASQPKTYSRGSNEFSTNSKAVSTAEEYQGSPETSGATSKDQQDSPINSNVEENKVQESGSNSSKCNNSSFTTGDSGYDNSTEKNKKGSPNNNNTSNPGNSKNINDHQNWKTTNNSNTEKISSCVALTEETLTAHDRLNHRFLKHRRNKMSLTSVTLPNEANRMSQQDESVPRKKFVTMSTLTQTDEVRVQPMSSPKVEFARPQTPRKTTANPVTVASTPQTVPTPGMYAAPSLQYAFAPSSVTLPAMPTPFLIPVVYMGAMPYYAPISNMMPSTGSPFWPATAMPLNGFSPMASTTSNNMHTNDTLEPPVIVQSSGVTATLPVATTTTTFASGTSPLFKNSKTSINAQCSENQATEEQVYMETNDSSDNMLCDSESSGPIGCSMNSSSGSRNNTEEMYLESKHLPKDSSENPPLQDNPNNMTTKMSYQYQMTVPDIRDILRKDHEFLSSHKQPDIVNQQLQMLQKEYAAENLKDEKDEGHADSTMLGLGQQELNEELDNREENLMQLMCDDV